MREAERERYGTRDMAKLLVSQVEEAKGILREVRERECNAEGQQWWR